MLRIGLLVAGLATLATAAAGQARSLAERLEAPFPYEAADVDVSAVLRDVARRSGVVVRAGDGVDGRVTVAGAEATLAEVLDEVAAGVDAVWWFDGAVLRLDDAEALTAAVVDARGLTPADLERELEALDLLDARFPIRPSATGALLRVSGPQGYVEQVVSLIDTLAAVRRLSLVPPVEGSAGLYLPRVYHGRPAA